VGHEERMEGDKKRTQNFSRRTKGKKPFGGPKRRLLDNIKMNLKELGCVRM
jgi:hypothetical protein